MSESKRWTSTGIDLFEATKDEPNAPLDCIATFDTAEQATLAAAAPEMYEALRTILARLDGKAIAVKNPDYMAVERERARAALAKATPPKAEGRS